LPQTPPAASNLVDIIASCLSVDFVGAISQPCVERLQSYEHSALANRASTAAIFDASALQLASA